MGGGEIRVGSMRMGNGQASWVDGRRGGGEMHGGSRWNDGSVGNGQASWVNGRRGGGKMGVGSGGNNGSMGNG